MIDLNVMNEDIVLKNGDFEIVTEEGRIISNAISVFLTTNFASYTFDNELGVDIAHMESIINQVLMIYFLNASLKWYIDQRIVSNFDIDHFKVDKKNNKTSFRLIINHIKGNNTIVVT